jgi:hypothetical protein
MSYSDFCGVIKKGQVTKHFLSGGKGTDVDTYAVTLNSVFIVSRNNCQFLHHLILVREIFQCSYFVLTKRY